jgi:hypothetical protein
MLDHEHDDFLQILHKNIEMLNSFPSHRNLAKKAIETLVDIALLCMDLVAFARKKSDKAKESWSIDKRWTSSWTQLRNG